MRVGDGVGTKLGMGLGDGVGSGVGRLQSAMLQDTSEERKGWKKRVKLKNKCGTVKYEWCEKRG